MKSNFKLFTMSMTLALGALIMLNSCSDDDKPVTFESDPDQFCSDNPFDSQCCIASQNIDCYCNTGDNATTDPECCLFEYNPTCYCGENGDDSRCEQPFGVGNGIGLIIDFESGLESFSPDFYNPSGQVVFDGGTNVTAVEGSHYLSLKMAADDPARDWHDFKYWPSSMDADANNDNEAMIDFSTMTNPTLNIWINTEMDSMALTLDFQTEFADGTKGEWAFHTALQTGTEGEWKLYSFDLKELVASGEYQSWGNTTTEFSITAYKHQMIKFALMAQNWAIAGNYTAHVDAISITDGPLTQLPWIK